MSAMRRTLMADLMEAKRELVSVKAELDRERANCSRWSRSYDEATAREAALRGLLHDAARLFDLGRPPEQGGIPPWEADIRERVRQELGGRLPFGPPKNAKERTR